MYLGADIIILDVLQVQNEFLSLKSTKQRQNGSPNFVRADERRGSGWENWGSGGLRGGMMEGGGIEDASYVQAEVREGEQPLRNVEKAGLGEKSMCQEPNSSHSGMQLNLNDELVLDYGSEGNDLDEMLDVELSQAEQNGADETNAPEQVEMTESRDQVVCIEEVELGDESEGEEEVSAGMKFLRELDRHFMCSSRMIVRGEYEGIVNGKMYKLFVRRKTEGTFVDWSLYNLDTRKQLLMIRGEMAYPFNITRTASEVGGVRVNGGWAWEGWAYGFCNLSELSDSYVNDPSHVHIDLLEAVFWTDEVYHTYHIVGPNCKNEGKGGDIDCTEGACGLRIWSIKITTFTDVAEEHELRPTTFRKDRELQTAFMSLVRFFDGQFKMVVHEGAGIGKFNEEGIWLSPVMNRGFNDSVASVDRKLLEKAKQIHRTRPSRGTDGDKGEDAAQVKLEVNDRFYRYLFLSQD